MSSRGYSYGASPNRDRMVRKAEEWKHNLDVSSGSLDRQLDVNDYMNFIYNTRMELDPSVHTIEWYQNTFQTSPKQGYFKFIKVYMQRDLN